MWVKSVGGHFLLATDPTDQTDLPLNEWSPDEQPLGEIPIRSRLHSRGIGRLQQSVPKLQFGLDFFAIRSVD